MSTGGETKGKGRGTSPGLGSPRGPRPQALPSHLPLPQAHAAQRIRAAAYFWAGREADTSQAQR